MHHLPLSPILIMIILSARAILINGEVMELDGEMTELDGEMTELDGLVESGGAISAPADSQAAPPDVHHGWMEAMAALGSDSEEDAVPNPGWAAAVAALSDSGDEAGSGGDDEGLVRAPVEGGAIVAAPTDADTARAVYDVQHATVAEILRSERHSFTTLASLCRRLPDDAFDQEAVNVSESCFVDSRVMSNSNMTDKYALSRSAVDTIKDLHAALGVEFERWIWKDCTESVAADPEIKIHTIIEYESYDGVDFKLRAECRSVERAQIESRMQTLMLCLLGADEAPGSTRDLLSTDDGKVLTKLLQRDSSCALIIEKDSKFHVVVGNFTYPLQASDRSTAECIAGMLREFGPDSSAADAAARKIRVTTTDSFTGNFRAERLNAEVRKGWFWISVFCHLHKIATAQARVVVPLDLEVSWLIGLAKSLEPAGEMNKMRSCLRRVIRDRRRVIAEPEPPDSTATDYKNLILDTFLPASEDTATIRLILLRCAPGDWRRTDSFDIFVAPGWTVAPTVNFIESMFVSCIAGCVPFVFPRSRWTGADRTLKQVGLFLGIHGLLRATYLLWFDSWHSTDADAGFTALGAGDAMMVEDQPGNTDNASRDAAQETKKDYKQLQIEANKLHRLTARRMLLLPHDRPMKELFAIRMILDPFMEYRNAEFKNNGWEAESVRWAECVSESGNAGDLKSFFKGSKKWPLLQAATGTLDDDLFCKLRTLPGDLASVPTSWKKLSYNHLLFRLITRAGCSMELLLARPHRTRIRLGYATILIGPLFEKYQI
jgi:hypothetical protein